MNVSVRDMMLKAAGYEGIVSGLRDVNLGAVELALDREMKLFAVDYHWEQVALADASSAQSYLSALRSAGVTVTCLLLANDFTRDDLDTEIDWVTRCARLAETLGSPSVRIDAIMRPAKEVEWPMERRVSVFVASMKRVIAATKDSPVQFGIENHGWPGNDPVFLKSIINQVGSPRLGVTLDTANFYWSGWPLERVHATIEELAPVTKHTHVKNINYPENVRDAQRERGWKYGEYCCPIDEGNIDMRRMVASLKSAGYDNDLCIENEMLGRVPPEERQQILKREARYLQSLL